LGEAEADLRHALMAYRSGSYNWSCFAAEQAAEKAMKAFLLGVTKRRPIHVHDLSVLHRQARNRLTLPVSVSMRLAELSSYYTVARYPNSGLTRPSISITATQAKSAIETARGIVKIVKRQITKRS